MMHPNEVARARTRASRKLKDRPNYGKGISIFKAVNAEALPRLRSLCEAWLPGGRMQGDEYVALNPTRNDGRPGSFKINTKKGVWADFVPGGGCGSDPISLYAFLKGLSQIEAARELARELGVRA